MTLLAFVDDTVSAATVWEAAAGNSDYVTEINHKLSRQTWDSV